MATPFGFFTINMSNPLCDEYDDFSVFSESSMMKYHFWVGASFEYNFILVNLKESYHQKRFLVGEFMKRFFEGKLRKWISAAGLLLLVSLPGWTTVQSEKIPAEMASIISSS